MHTAAARNTPADTIHPLHAQARRIEQQARWADGPAWQQDLEEARRLRQQAASTARPSAREQAAAQARQLARTRQARADTAARLAAIASLGHTSTTLN